MPRFEEKPTTLASGRLDALMALLLLLCTTACAGTSAPASRDSTQVETGGDAGLSEALTGKDQTPADGSLPDLKTNESLTPDGAADTTLLPEALEAGGAQDTAAGPDSADAGGTPSLKASDCLQRTPNEAACKDCCDCLALECALVTACRDQCPLLDYSENSDFVTFEVPTDLGPGGDYSLCTAKATEPECKDCCCGDQFACGDRKYCRNACAGSSQWPALDFSKMGVPKLIAATFQFTEGPAWDVAKNLLLFSDVQGDTIYQFVLPDKVTVYRTPSHQANGLAFDKEGRLLAAEHQSRSVTRTAADGSVSALASTWEGKPLNSPNDLVVRKDGTVYFTDPTYGLGSTPSALGYTGLFRIAPDGTLALEAKVDGAPNGVALSPDATILYVAATTAGKLWAFPVSPDGTLGQPAEFAKVDSPDGLAVDQGGNIYVAAMDAGKGAVVVMNHLAKVLGKIPLDYQPTNCGFGGQDGKTLFVTARAALYQIKVPIPGLM